MLLPSASARASLRGQPYCTYFIVFISDGYYKFRTQVHKASEQEVWRGVRGRVPRLGHYYACVAMPAVRGDRIVAHVDKTVGSAATFKVLRF